MAEAITVETGIKLYGLAEFLANAKNIREQMRTAVLKSAAVAGAKTILDGTKAICPVGAEAREPTKHWAHGEVGGVLVATKWSGRYPGQLRDSVTMTVSAAPDHALAAIGPGPEGFYGRFLEFGTVRMAARPFMRPAFDGSAPRAIETMRQKMAYFIESQGTK